MCFVAEGKTFEGAFLKACFIWEKPQTFLVMKRDCVVCWLGLVHIVSLPNSEQNFVVFICLMLNRWNKHLNLAQDGRAEGLTYSVAPLFQNCCFNENFASCCCFRKKKVTLANNFLFLLPQNVVHLVFGISLIANIVLIPS